MVRRAERGIGVAIRNGQEAGEIRGAGQGRITSRTDQVGDTHLVAAPGDFVPYHELSGGGGSDQAGIYALTDDITDEQFEDALTEAKAEQNLSRANVVRKVRNEPARPGRLSLVPRRGARSRRLSVRSVRVMTLTEQATDPGPAPVRPVFTFSEAAKFDPDVPVDD